MIDNGYLYAKNNLRLFINTSLGCSGQCSYCYLPKIGYNNKGDVNQVISAEEILDMIKQYDYELNNDTLITLGCFSECFDEKNKPETLKLIKHFLKKGNQIQLSTKKEMRREDFKDVSNFIQYTGQLIIFISSATISSHSQLEKGTDEPQKRFKSFENLKDLNIPLVLYLKPILENITYKDIDLYLKFIKKYDIKDVVIGSIFKKKESNETVPFSDKKELFYNPISDEEKFIVDLNGKCNIFRRSTQVINYYKNNKDDSSL